MVRKLQALLAKVNPWPNSSETLPESDDMLPLRCSVPAFEHDVLR
jgi:hypothetical protein